MTVQPVVQPVVRDILALTVGRVKCQEVPFCMYLPNFEQWVGYLFI